MKQMTITKNENGSFTVTETESQLSYKFGDKINAELFVNLADKYQVTMRRFKEMNKDFEALSDTVLIGFKSMKKETVLRFAKEKYKQLWTVEEICLFKELVEGIRTSINDENFKGGKSTLVTVLELAEKEKLSGKQDFSFLDAERKAQVIHDKVNNFDVNSVSAEEKDFIVDMLSELIIKISVMKSLEEKTEYMREKFNTLSEKYLVYLLRIIKVDCASDFSSLLCTRLIVDAINTALFHKQTNLQ